MKARFLKQWISTVFSVMVFLSMSVNTAAAETALSQIFAAVNTTTSAQPVEPVPRPGTEDSAVRDTGGVVVTGYTINRTSGSSSTTIAKNDSVRISVSMKIFHLKTEDIRSNTDLGITKTLDSFIFNGTPQVEVTSKRGETLTFTVIFNQAQYKGTGNSLKFMISYAASLNLTSDSCEINITECEEFADQQNTEQDPPSAPVLQLGRSDFAAPLTADQPFTMNVTITNRSTTDTVENVTAVFEPDEGLVLMESTSSKIIPSIAPGQTATVPVNLKTASELTNASQNLSVSLKYSSQINNRRVEGEASEKIVIPVTPNKTAEDSQNTNPDVATPNIIVSKYSYGEQVAAGETFDLVLEFQNTSKTNAAENIVMSLDPAEGLSITASSNTFYLPVLGAGATHTETIQMQALPGAKSESTKIEISFKYEFVDQEKRTSVTAGERIAIPVYQPNRFELTPPDMAVEAYVGQEASISIAYVNKGKSEISNVEALLENDQVDVMEKHQNLGNFEAGKSGSIDFIVTPFEEGEIQLVITLQYEDSNLQVQTEEIPVTLNVMSLMTDDDMYFEDPIPEEEKDQGIFLWIILITILLAGGTALFFVIRKRRKKKAKALEEDFVWEELDDSLPEEQPASKALPPSVEQEEAQKELQHEKE